MMRPVAAVGPRSLTLQVADAPVTIRVTFTIVPKGRVRWAHVPSGALNHDATPLSVSVTGRATVVVGAGSNVASGAPSAVVVVVVAVATGAGAGLVVDVDRGSVVVVVVAFLTVVVVVVGRGRVVVVVTRARIFWTSSGREMVSVATGSGAGAAGVWGSEPSDDDGEGPVGELTRMASDAGSDGL